MQDLVRDARLSARPALALTRSFSLHTSVTPSAMARGTLFIWARSMLLQSPSPFKDGLGQLLAYHATLPGRAGLMKTVRLEIETYTISLSVFVAISARSRSLTSQIGCALSGHGSKVSRFPT